MIDPPVGLLRKTLPKILSKSPLVTQNLARHSDLLWSLAQTFDMGAISPLKKGTSTFSGLIFALLLKPEKENVPFFNGPLLDVLP
jgi:hypothetical protein